MSASPPRAQARRTQSNPHANRSLVEFEPVSGMMQRILKIAEQRLAQGATAVAALNGPMAATETASVRPTLRNVVGSSTCRADTAETRLVGWGGRTRTSEWRNQNPPDSLSISSAKTPETRTMPAKNRFRLNHLCHTEQARPEPGHSTAGRSHIVAADVTTFASGRH
jgi:hypothetical protein